MNEINIIKKSEEIAELAKALAIAQSELENPLKEALNPHFRSKYADLSSVLNCVRAVFPKNGLSVMQHPSFQPNLALVETIIMHSSGQWMSSVSSCPLQKQDAQGVGSAITYLRRYSLSAICGIAQEDDDGNSATTSNDKEYKLPNAKSFRPVYRDGPNPQQEPIANQTFITEEGKKKKIDEIFKDDDLPNWGAEEPPKEEPQKINQLPESALAMNRSNFKFPEELNKIMKMPGVVGLSFSDFGTEEISELTVKLFEMERKAKNAHNKKVIKHIAELFSEELAFRQIKVAQ